MMQREVLDAMHEEHAFRVVIQHRVQREIEQRETGPEKRLAGTRHPVHALAPDE